MRIPMRLRVDAGSPIPIRWQRAEQLKHVIEGGGVPRDEALPGIRELAGFLGINPNTVTHAIEDLKRSGHAPLARGRLGPRAVPVPRQVASGERRRRDSQVAKGHNPMKGE
jgi:DNA-binding transcriptional MocR family regulator